MIRCCLTFEQKDVEIHKNKWLASLDLDQSFHKTEVGGETNFGLIRGAYSFGSQKI